MDRLVKLEPSNQVVIRIEPGQRCYGVLTLRNVMYTMPVAFRVLPLNQARFTIRPQTGILAPLSTLRIEITYLPQQPTVPLIPDCVPRSDDCFYVDSVVCVGATSSALDAVPASWFNAKKKQVFTDSGLRIFYTGSAVLARLIEDGEMEKVREVLEQSDPDWHAADSTDAHGRTLLQLAIARGRADLVQLLIEFSADVEAASQGRSPLEAAAAYGQTIIAELLLARGASTGGDTPLHVAAAAGDEVMARLLIAGGCAGLKDARNRAGAIEIGAAVDGRDGSGWTALMMAGFKGWMEVIRLLLAKGAQIDARDEEGYTALHCAVEAGTQSMWQILIGYLDLFLGPVSGPNNFPLLADKCLHKQNIENIHMIVLGI
ncbi:Ankyrin repeat-containing protein [Dendrobium catenatum]|uniref:Ankyrin repeat-containing protein n=1 Tax=Dendrobium catenatum TaxID=906689 RepID=A0A2I0X6Q1_9ASPA|nr:Ankyrin repeat-containing protein [Dendrobium catenatum]